MCCSETTLSTHKLRSFSVAVGNLIIHATLVCFSIAILIVTRDSSTLSSLMESNPLRRAVHNFFGKFDPPAIHVVFGIILVMAFLGVIAAITLIIGLRHEKPCCVVIYMSYGVQTTILLLIGVLFSLIKFHWYLAILLLTCVVASVQGLYIVSRTHDTMNQEVFVQDSETSSSSDLQLLIED